LEQISKVWLVAKMIQSLYEYILSEKGLGDFLKDIPGEIHDKSKPLLDKRSHNLDQHKSAGKATESSDKSGERLASQGPALTPALLAHLFAALKSGTSSSSSENGDSLKDGPEGSNPTCHQQPAHLTSPTSGELYIPHLDTGNVPHVSHQFTEGPKSEQLFTAQAPANIHISQFMPQQNVIDYDLNMYAGPQIMAMGNLPAQGLQLPQDHQFMQNLVDGSQYFPNEVGELQYSWPANGVGYYTSGPDYTLIDNTMTQPPAPTGPNVLEWSVDSIHT
jgi:hypothetical protein